MKYDYEAEMKLPLYRRPIRILTPDMLGTGFNIEDAKNGAKFLTEKGVRCQAREKYYPEGNALHIDAVKCPMHIWVEMLEYVKEK